jgi:hypothetical protein
MSTSLTSTGVQFPDATIQTTASTGGGGLGYGQTWTLSSPRYVSTTYTNSTGKPIALSIGASGPYGVTLTLTINGTTIMSNYSSTSAFVNGIVPVGQTYSVSGPSGGTSGTVNSWLELK